mmetsp:Transcript_73552/g.163441  ORF Transcript_73552/g.163441 Transcript_73552/m.163441 type:complete len:261 (+) Transcript_73552:449-1231(+)
MHKLVATGPPTSAAACGHDRRGSATSAHSSPLLLLPQGGRLRHDRLGAVPLAHPLDVSEVVRVRVGLGSLHLEDGRHKRIVGVQADICDREALATQEGSSVRKGPVEPAQACLCHCTHRFGNIGVHISRDAALKEFEHRPRTKGLDEGHKVLAVNSAEPRVRDGAIGRRLANKVRAQPTRLYVIKILADRHALGEARAIWEHEGRHLAHRIDTQKLGTPVGSLADVHVLHCNRVGRARLLQVHVDRVRRRRTRASVKDRQ